MEKIWKFQDLTCHTIPYQVIFPSHASCSSRPSIKSVLVVLTASQAKRDPKKVKVQSLLSTTMWVGVFQNYRPADFSLKPHHFQMALGFDSKSREISQKSFRDFDCSRWFDSAPFKLFGCLTFPLNEWKRRMCLIILIQPSWQVFLQHILQVDSFLGRYCFNKFKGLPGVQLR